MMTSISSSMVSSWASNLFSKLDTNNQGYLQKSDLENAFSNISSSSSSTSDSTSSVDNLFTQLDSNSDGKVTKDELTSALQKVADQLDSQFNSMRMGHGGGMPPPPPDGMGGGMASTGSSSGTPPAPPQNDTGFTKDELTSQLQDIGSSDSKRAQFLTNVVNNFDQADTDGDGKVTFKEAQALNQSLNASSTTSTTSTSGSSDSSNSSSSGTSQDQVLSQIMQLMQAYQVFGSNGDQDRQFGLSSLLSVSA